MTIRRLAFALLLASLALVHVPAQSTQMGVDEIRPGMVGIGRTVFEAPFGALEQTIGESPEVAEIRIALLGTCAVRVVCVDDLSLTLRTLKGHRHSSSPKWAMNCVDCLSSPAGV